MANRTWRCPIHYADINKTHTTSKMSLKDKQSLPAPPLIPQKSNDWPPFEWPEHSPVVVIPRLNVSFKKLFCHFDNMVPKFNIKHLRSQKFLKEHFGIIRYDLQQLPNSSIRQRKRWDRFSQRIKTSMHNKLASECIGQRLPLSVDSAANLGISFSGVLSYHKDRFGRMKRPLYFVVCL
jgi:hypothetical protein